MLIGGRHYSVVHPFPFTPWGNYAGASQVGKMTRDFWLVGFQDFHQEADADLVIAHETEQAQTSAIRERPEKDFDFSVF